MKSYPPLSPKLPVLWHGGDYNPEQWPREVWDRDMELMTEAHVNVATIGVFSWVSLEPEEGKYTFEWMDRIMDMLHETGKFAVLATPSAAPPAWMSKKYPEILRTGPDRVRRLHSNRVNFDWSSPVYRGKVREMSTKLAERYGNHPALVMWHVSNEYGGESFSEFSRQAFIKWLRAKFNGNLDALNAAYWTPFWGHTYTDWDQIEIPGVPYSESAIHGLTLDWKRFNSDEIIDFFLNESAPLREISPDIPITTNLMGFYKVLNPWKLAPHLDVIAWDSYPQFSETPMDVRSWQTIAMSHDMNRSLKGGKPFLLIESTPSSSNWYPYMNLKPPRMHHLEGIQAVAHGSEGMMYFQWRQSRGSQEKFHGAVLTHGMEDRSRIFKEVAELGSELSKLGGAVGSVIDAQVAIIYDWENAWAVEDSVGPIQGEKGYHKTCLDHYAPLWEAGIATDIVSSDTDLSKYKLVIAPMLYMTKPGVAERLEGFVREGGVLVGTYFSGYVDENDLVHLDGLLGPLRKVFGIEVEEIDALFPEQSVSVVAEGENSIGLVGSYKARFFCERIAPMRAEVVARYGDIWYGGEAAVTRNELGKGQAIYVASRNGADFTMALVNGLVSSLGIESAAPFELPSGVTASRRGEYLFVMNATQQAQTLVLQSPFLDVLTGVTVDDSLELPSYGAVVLSAVSAPVEKDVFEGYSYSADA